MLQDSRSNLGQNPTQDTTQNYDQSNMQNLSPQHVNAFNQHRASSARLAQYAQHDNGDTAAFLIIIERGFAEGQVLAQRGVAGDNNNLNALIGQFKTRTLTLPGFDQASFEAGLEMAGRIEGAKSVVQLSGTQQVSDTQNMNVYPNTNLDGTQNARPNTDASQYPNSNLNNQVRDANGNLVPGNTLGQIRNSNGDLIPGPAGTVRDAQGNIIR